MAPATTSPPIAIATLALAPRTVPRDLARRSRFASGATVGHRGADSLLLGGRAADLLGRRRVRGL